MNEPCPVVKGVFHPRMISPFERVDDWQVQLIEIKSCYLWCPLFCRWQRDNQLDKLIYQHHNIYFEKMYLDSCIGDSSGGRLHHTMNDTFWVLCAFAWCRIQCSKGSSEDRTECLEERMWEGHKNLKTIVPVLEVCHAETLHASASGRQVIRRINMMGVFWMTEAFSRHWQYYPCMPWNKV